MSLGLERDFKHKAYFLCSLFAVITALVCGLILYITQSTGEGLLVISRGVCSEHSHCLRIHPTAVARYIHEAAAGVFCPAGGSICLIKREQLKSSVFLRSLHFAVFLKREKINKVRH